MAAVCVITCLCVFLLSETYESDMDDVKTASEREAAGTTGQTT